MVAAARKLGLSVVKSDILEHLKKTLSNSYDVVTAIHVVEHFTPEMAAICLSEVFRILRADGMLILETPNPHAIDAFKAFWLDSTHVRPYFPESLLFKVRKAGFNSAYILTSANESSLDDRLDLSGSYSLIARKGDLTSVDYRRIESEG
jgi:predicted SAM-dependent methyltransferase